MIEKEQHDHVFGHQNVKGPVNMNSTRSFLVSLAAFSAIMLWTAAFSPNAASETIGGSYSLPPVRLDAGAVALLNAGQWEKALPVLLSLYDQPEADNAIRYYISTCYFELGKQAYLKHQIQEAVTLFEAALTYAKDIPAIYVSLASSHLKRSDYDEAEQALLQAIALDPSIYTAYRELGEISYIRNDMESALEYWNQALKLDDTDTDFKKRVANLRKQLELTQYHDVESDYHFSISVDGDVSMTFKDRVYRMLDDIYFDIGDRLNAYPKRQIAVVLLKLDDFQNVTDLPRWVSGVYEGQIKIPVVSGDPEALKPILAHEYIHAVIYDIMSDRCPWWLNEGLAQYFSGDESGNRLKLNKAAEWIRQNDIPDLQSFTADSIQNSDQALKCYSLALSATCFLIDMVQPYNLQSVLAKMGEGVSLDMALASVTGYKSRELLDNWLSSYR